MTEPTSPNQNEPPREADSPPIADIPPSTEPEMEMPPDDDTGPGVGQEYPPDPPMPEE